VLTHVPLVLLLSAVNVLSTRDMACSLRFSVSTRIVWLFGVDVYLRDKHSAKSPAL
jgi:hypothetical protein